MAWTNVGFDGTINEAQWSQMSTLMGSSGGGYLAAGNGDCLVTAVPGARSVSVAAGSLYGDGVVSTNSAPEVVAMTTPVNGQWYVIALRRTWATNTAALVAIAGATTSTTTPTAPPTSFPTLNTNQGVLTDQPIAWAWCNSANTTVVVYDIRLKGIKSTPPVVANATERDAKFMTPTQGLQVWRDDLGVVETYANLYDPSTNPGGREVAGWNKVTKVDGLIPVIPTTVTAVSGSASLRPTGQVQFSNVTKISLDGVFNLNYDHYRALITLVNGSGGVQYLRFITNGTEVTTGNYSYQGIEAIGTSLGTFRNTSQSEGRFAFHAGGTRTAAAFDIFGPDVPSDTGVFAHTTGNNGGAWVQETVTYFSGSNLFTGMSFYPSAGSMSGAVQFYAWND